MIVLAIALQMIVVHRVDGLPITVNPAHVTALHATAASVGKPTVFTGRTQCAIGMSDGKWLSVIESCESVRKMLEDAGRNGR